MKCCSGCASRTCNKRARYSGWQRADRRQASDFKIAPTLSKHKPTERRLAAATNQCKSRRSRAAQFVCRRRIARARLRFTMQAHRTLSFGLALIFPALQQSTFAEGFSGIAVPENSVIVLSVAAEGVQIYESKRSPAGGFQWSLKAPEAELKSTSGEVLANMVPDRVGLSTMAAAS